MVGKITILQPVSKVEFKSRGTRQISVVTQVTILMDLKVTQAIYTTLEQMINVLGVVILGTGVMNATKFSKTV